MLIQKNWSIFAENRVKTEVMISDNLCRNAGRDAPRHWERWLASLEQVAHIIIHEKITKKKAKLFTSTELLKFYLFTINK